jgi:hypothetical protein
MAEWESVLKDVAGGGSIRAAYLRKIPHLKTCDNWKDVTFLGRVSLTLPYAVYDGGLVKLADRIYYINSRQIEVVRRFAHFRNLDKSIAVTES